MTDFIGDIMNRIIIFLFAGLFIVLAGCDYSNNEDNEYSGLNDKYSIQDYARAQEIERYALLSAKYEINDTLLIENLVNDYLKRQDFVAYLSLMVLQEREVDAIFPGKVNAFHTIEELSEKYSISKSKLSKIIIDYKILLLINEIRFIE